MRASPFVFALALVTCARSAAVAGPPFVTDDPEPTGYRQWEIYVFAEYANDVAATTTGLPSLELNYGLMPNVQVSFTAPFAYAHSPEDGAHAGYGDSEFAVKVRFVQETKTSPQVAFYPSVSFPSGGEDLGEGRVRTFLPIWLQKSWGKWTAYGGAGISHQNGSDERNGVFTGATLLDQVSEHIAFGAELFHQTPENVRTPATSGFNVGTIVAAGEHHNLLFSIGRGLGGTNALSAYGAYELELGAPAKPESKP